MSSASGGMKFPLNQHLDKFLLSGYTGYLFEDINKVVGMSMKDYVKLPFTVTATDVRTYLSTKAESINMTNEQRAHIARYIGHDLQTAKYNYVAPSKEGVVQWKAQFDRCMPAVRDAQEVKCGANVQAYKFSKFFTNRTTQQFCLIKARSLGLTDLVTASDFNNLKDMDLPVIFDYMSEELKLINGFVNPRVTRLLRTRTGKGITVATVTDRMSHLSYRLAVLMIHNYRHEHGLTPTSESTHELMMRSEKRLWPLVTVGDAIAQNGDSIGKGVFARRDILAGVFVCEYYYKKSWSGYDNIAQTAEYNPRPAPGCNYYIISQIRKIYYDAWCSVDNVGMLLNHSSIHIFIRTTRPIEQCEQLVWKYSSNVKSPGLDATWDCVGGCRR